METQRQDLKQLWSKGNQVREAMKIIDQIDTLKNVPDKLESLISEKRWIEAVLLLINSLKAINQPSLRGVGAIVDLRLFLQSQESALREMLIEELHNHVYLKSVYSETRWKPYKPNKEPPSPVPSEASEIDNNFEKYLNNLQKVQLKDYTKVEENNLRVSTSSTMNIPSPSLISNNSPIPSPSLQHEFSVENVQQDRNSVQLGASESDSFEYIQTVLESLNALGKLSDALDLIPQRLPIEVQSIISSTIDQIASRSDSHQKTNAKGDQMPASSAVTAGIISSLFKNAENMHKARELDMGAYVLRELFRTLFSKLEAVLQGLRVVSEVSYKLVGDKLQVSLKEMWKLMQFEIQSLIQGYLVDDSHGIGSTTNLVASINDVLRQVQNSRDRSKYLFKFSDTDIKSCTRVIKPHEEALQRILQTTMPGLVSNQTSNANLIESTNIPTSMELERNYTRIAKADPFNIPVFFQPTCSFIDKCIEILGISGISLNDAKEGEYDQQNDLRDFMDTFIEKVFLPQLQDKVMELFQGAVASSDAFSEETDRIGETPKPVVKVSKYSERITH